MRINVAFCITDNWTEYCLITIASILKNASSDDEYHFYIIYSSLTQENQEKFSKLNQIKKAEYHFIEVDDNEFSPITHNHLGTVVCYRLKIPYIINESKILYIDSDLMAHHDIRELYSYDITDYYIAGVEDKQLDMRTRVHLPETQQYTNGGMLLMNLDKLRKDDFYKKSCDMLLKKQWTDQDVVNEFCQDKLLQLPLKYNVMYVPFEHGYRNRREDYKEAIKDPVIIHFSIFKPWNIKAQPFADEWTAYEELVHNLLQI